LELGKAGVFGLAGLYAVGMLIVNLHLGRYGVVLLDLARAEYVMAGVMWVLVTFPVAKAFELGVRGAREARGLVRRSLAILLWLFVTIAAAVLSTTLVTLSRFANYLDRDLLLAVGVVVWTAVVLWRIGHKVTELLTSLVRRGGTFAILPGFDTIVWGFVLLGCLTAYSGTVFPAIPKRIGGGERPLVRLRLVEPLPAAHGTELPVSADRQTIGPVVLLFEGDARITVTRRQASSTTNLWVKNVGPTITINRDRLSLLEYLSPDSPE
jgi:hypothetical protein